MTIRKRMLRHGPRTGVLAASIGALLASGGVTVTAFAQEDEEDEEAAPTRNDEAIVVTGTRIRRDDFTSTNATVVITAEDMRNLGVTSVAEMINQLPSNVANITPETQTDSAFNLGASIANLRGMNTSNGGTRTLVLVDSSRFISSNSSGSVDLNMIPTALVGRIESVTGGASAAYGSDAIAGVVNVILDNNIEGLRVDLSYNVDDEGEGDNVNLSLGTGFEVLNRRGRVTLGYDYSVTDPIYDCTTREWCAAGRSMIRNGDAIWVGVTNMVSPQAPPYSPLEPTTQYFPGEPQYLVTEGMRYTNVREGMLLASGPTDSTWQQYLNGSIPLSQVVFATNPGAASPTAVGTYRLSDDGRSIESYLDNLTTGQRNFITNQGATGGASPWGEGDPIYYNQPLKSESNRHNLFTRFNYDLENGISLDASLTFSQNDAFSVQNSARNTANFNPGCIFPDNAFLSQQWGASAELRELFADRAQGTNPTPGSQASVPMGCRPAPFLGQTFLDDSLPNAQERWDYPMNGGTTGLRKSTQGLVQRENDTTTETTQLAFGARGDLFEGGSWTWDTRLTVGTSERHADVNNWQSNRRLEMAMHSVWDPTANGNQGGAVCAIDSGAPYVEPTGPGPDFVTAYEPFATMGEYWEARWLAYITDSLDDSQATPEFVQAWFDNLAGRPGSGQAPCAPFNPFGIGQTSQAALDFAFPSIIEGSDNEQSNLSVSFSGDIGSGIGAGPFRMAAGMDYRENTSQNLGNPNQFAARDFSFNFADAYGSDSENKEAFVEFELPLLRDTVAADYLMVNVAARHTESTSRQIEGNAGFVTNQSSRESDSWKASMVWAPVDLMRVRLTRSADIRQPSDRELFQSAQPALSNGGFREVQSPFRINYTGTGTPAGVNESYDEVEVYGGDGGNSNLQEERSITQTLGFVFTPTELLTGLSISVDYFETEIEGGIQNITADQVAQLCLADLIANEYVLESTTQCENVVFDLENPDPTQMYEEYGAAGVTPNPLYPYSNVLAWSSSSRNQEDFFSRGIDLSVSYNTQLSGGGLLNARVLTSRALEQEVDANSGLNGLFPLFNAQGGINVRDVSGQTGSNGIGSIWGSAAGLFTNYSPTPRISGNAFMTYQKNAFSVTGQIRYVGTGKLAKQNAWIGYGESGQRVIQGGAQIGQIVDAPWAPNISATVYNNDLPSWTTLNLNFEYNFSRSRLSFERFESLSAYFNITNVADRIPDFFSGNAAGGVNSTYFSGLGRQYRMGVRMQF
jgi:outer membrane receptor protein involved in Fe transport